MEIIFASKSSGKKQLLKKLGIKFKIDPSDYKERMDLKLRPKELTKYLSYQKAKVVAKKYKSAIIIATDSFITFEGRLLGKPHTEKKARKMLKELSGKAHSVITGFTIINTKNKKTISKSVETKVYFKKLTQKDIDNYVKTKEPLDKAGAYAIQGLGASLVNRIEGDYSNIIGLPLKTLTESLKKFNIKIPKERF